MSNTPSVPSKDELIAKALNELVNLYNTGKDFAVEQVPDVIRQLIIYNTVQLALMVAFSFLFLLAGLYAGSRLFKLHKKAVEQRVHYYDGGWMVGTILCPAGGTMIWAAIFFNHIGDLLKITLAPKVWLLEYAASLVK